MNGAALHRIKTMGTHGDTHITHFQTITPIIKTHRHKHTEAINTDNPYKVIQQAFAWGKNVFKNLPLQPLVLGSFNTCSLITWCSSWNQSKIYQINCLEIVYVCGIDRLPDCVHTFVYVQNSRTEYARAHKHTHRRVRTHTYLHTPAHYASRLYCQ